MAFHGQKQLLHVVQLFRAVAFHRDPQLQVQHGTVAARTANPVECDGVDSHGSIGRGIGAVGGVVVEPYALGSDGVGKDSEKVGQRRTHIAHGRTPAGR